MHTYVSGFNIAFKSESQEIFLHDCARVQTAMDVDPPVQLVFAINMLRALIAWTEPLGPD